MGTPKHKPVPYPQEKQAVEALIKRLNERLLKDPKLCKKAALIIESWLRKS